MKNNVRVGMVITNPTVGAFDANVQQIKNGIEELGKQHCDLVCFPECAISGYPAEDLVLWNNFTQTQFNYLNDIAEFTHNMATAFIVGCSYNYNSLVYNVAALICNGKVQAIIPKEELPNYDVFYDGRQFTAGLPYIFDDKCNFGDAIFEMPWGKMGVAICEDMWTTAGPIPRRAFSGAELIVNISASPWRHNVVETRENILKSRSEDNQIALVYVNQFGGNDALIFDGGAWVAQNGDVVFRSPRWENFIGYYDVDLQKVRQGRKQNTTWRNDQHRFEEENGICEVVKVSYPEKQTPKIQRNVSSAKTANYFMPVNPVGTKINPLSETVNAMITGLNDYYEKIGAFDGVAIGASGGRDSVLTTLIAAEWAYRTERDPKIVHTFSMPSQYNSTATQSIAADIANNLGVSFASIPIKTAFEEELSVAKTMSEKDTLSPLTVQNMQARIRGMRMWNVCNELNLLWLQTGNMSEKAVGYTTIGGDMMGGYSLLGNMPKTVVNDLLYNMSIFSNVAFMKILDTKGEMIKSNLATKIERESQHRKMMDNQAFALCHYLDILLGTEASAELSDDQADERDLMPFEILDLCYWLFVKEKKTPQEIYDYLVSKFDEKDLSNIASYYKKGMLKQWIVRFIKLFFRSIYKWTQSPQAVHMGPIDLDRERALQIPVVQSLEWLDLDIVGNA